MQTFKGGVHPPEYKESTQDLAIEDCPLPEIAYVSLGQHLGKPAKPIVQVGDSVEEGQMIAEADGFISANIHAPISGTVKKIAKAPQVAGTNVDTIIIERNKDIPPKEWTKKKLKPTDINLETFINTLKTKGIVGLGGAVFPTHVKFMLKPDQKLHTIMINACECEPYLNVDYRTILEETDLFIEGLNIIKKATKVTRIIIGVENNKPKALEKLKTELKTTLAINVVPLKTKYPQGGEKMLVKALTKQEVPSGGLPIDLGMVILNVNTVIAIAQAFIYDKPLTEKLITVSGKGIKKPKNIRAKIGTPINEILAFCDGLKDDTQRLVIGGPMMGMAQADTSASVLKSTSGILALTKEEIGVTELAPCIKCGKCVTACPMRLLPTKIAKFVEHKRLDLALKASIKDCIECGSCVYVCPARRPLLQLIKYGKIQALKEAVKKKG
jgi:Na+-translocating ferredoxin:NAD+ oxidoreductase subunit C